MNADGTSLRELECGETTGVGWSPDGQQFVVEVLSQLVVVNVDGSGRRVIPNTGDSAAHPDWSPDGSKIVYVARGATTYGLRVIAPDGSGARVLVADSDEPLQFPRWSPDGGKIALDAGSSSGGILILRSDGSDTGASVSAPGDAGSLRSPAWASGGAQLCYSVTKGTVDTPNGMFVQNVDNSGTPTRLTGEQSLLGDCFAGVAPSSAPATSTSAAAPRSASGDAPAVAEVVPLDPGRAATNRASAAAHRLGRSSLATALRAPNQVSTDIGLVLANVALALGFVVLVFPAVLFNSTLEENYDEIRGWFGRRGPRKERPQRAAWRRWAAFTAVGVLMALAYALVDPKAKADQATVLLVAGVAGAAVIDTLFGGLIGSAFLNPRTRERGRIRSYPGALLIGASGVAVSRAVHFLPGYLYGVVGGFDRKVEPKKSDSGAAAALGALGGVVLAVCAWVLFQPVTQAAAKRGASLSTLVLEAVLAAIATVSFQSLLFSMMPIRTLPGAKVWAWNRIVWALFVGLGAFGILHLFLHPSDPYKGSVVVMLTLFAGFGSLSIAFWAYFRFRKPRPGAPAPAPVSPSPSTRRQRPLRAAGR